jgi:hypothetical protein
MEAPLIVMQTFWPTLCVRDAGELKVIGARAVGREGSGDRDGQGNGGSDSGRSKVNDHLLHRQSQPLHEVDRMSLKEEHFHPLALLSSVHQEQFQLTNHQPNTIIEWVRLAVERCVED